MLSQALGQQECPGHIRAAITDKNRFLDPLHMRANIDVRYAGFVSDRIARRDPTARVL
jgi:hypothetical protein